MNPYAKFQGLSRQAIIESHRGMDEKVTALEKELGDAQSKISICESIKELAKDAIDERQMVEKERDTLKARVADFEALKNRLDNGIKYDEEHNQYVVCWTKREIDEAKKEADELYKFFKKD